MAGIDAVVFFFNITYIIITSSICVLLNDISNNDLKYKFQINISHISSQAQPYSD